MRVLLDECVPRRLRTHLTGHDVATVVEMGWAGVKNGRLLALAAIEFDCLITVDANVEHQQHLPDIPIAILLVQSVSNEISVLRQMVPEIISALTSIQPKQFARIGAQTKR